MLLLVDLVGMIKGRGTYSTAMHSLPEEQASDQTTLPEKLRQLADQNSNLAQLVAKNASADPELLRELGNRASKITRKGVVSNPNTPTDVLFRLGAEFPRQLLDNPVFSLLLLENPNLIEQIPLTTLQSILKQEDIPVSFLEKAVSRDNQLVLETIAQHPNTPGTVLDRVAEKASWLGKYLAQHANTLEATLGKLARDKNSAVRQSVAKHPNTPGQVLDWLAEDLGMSGVRVHEELGFIRRIIASNPKTLEKTLERLAEDQMQTMNIGRDIRLAVAGNHNTPLSVLEKLSKDKHNWIPDVVAVHPKLTENLLLKMKLAPNEQAAHDLWLAKQSTTPINILEQLAEHNWNIVRLAVARNLNTPEYLLFQTPTHLRKKWIEKYIDPQQPA
jgi:hypothetical protein